MEKGLENLIRLHVGVEIEIETNSNIIHFEAGLSLG